jgi:acyl-CoA thioesterase-1
MRSTQTIFALLFIILLSLGARAETTNILVYGDSLSAAYNMPVEKGWVYLMEQELKKQSRDISIKNGSISGETTSGGLTRFEKQLSAGTPDIVILELGANDGLRGTDLKTTRANLTTMIDMSHEVGASVILAGIHLPPNFGRTYTKRFDQIFIDLSKREKVSFIPFILENVATIPELTQRDGLHPNEKAQPIIVTNVLPYLLPLLP